MADFKCKYCGNHLHPEEDKTIITCGRCGESTRIIIADNAKKQRLMSEAADLRYNCLFDRAMQRYESIIHEFPTEGDAYWGYVLCLYGVEFQDDIRTGKRLPTLHRISTRSILQDPYFQKAIEYANPIDALDYKRIATELDRIRQRFIELSQKEENRYDIFISFKQTDDKLHRETIDCSKAENLYYKLKDMGYRVFFSKVTLANRGGEDYEPIIYTALESAKIMLIVSSCKENLEAPWVRNEWNRFIDMIHTNKNKKILPVYFGNMTPEELPDELRQIQGYDVDTQRGVDRVLSRVEQLLPCKNNEQSNDAIKTKEFVASEESLLKRANMEIKIKNWSKAGEYYNRILDANPECCEAWIGLMLSEEHHSDLESYKDYLFDKWLQSEMEVKSVFLQDNVEADLINSYVVPNYLMEEDIYTMFPENLTYDSEYNSMCKNQKEAEQYFDSNQNYKHAMDCADDLHKQILIDLKREILDKINEKIKISKNKDIEESVRLKEEYKERVNIVKKEIMERHQHAINQRDIDYKAGMEVHSAKEVSSAIQRLKKVGNYREAPQKLEKLIRLQKLNDMIGDGTTYLAQTMINENPQVIIDFQNTLANLSNKSNEGKRITIGLYIFVMLAFIISGDIRTIACISIGVGLGAMLWKKKYILTGYIVFAIFHTIAGAFLSSEWIIIMPVIYIISYVRKNGWARIIISRKIEKIAVDNAKENISNYEKNICATIDEIWNDAIGINYDGVKLQSVLDIIEKNGYMI